jgi:hypothetical protein
MLKSLFKSPEDKMKEAMIFGSTPLGKDIKTMMDKVSPSSTESFYMASYTTLSPYNLVSNEILFLKDDLEHMNLGLAICQEAWLFFADLKKVTKYEANIRSNLLKEEYMKIGIPWVALVRLFWEDGIPMANLKVNSNGFEVHTYTLDGKSKKLFIPMRKNI